MGLKSIDGPEFSCLHILCTRQRAFPFQIIIKAGRRGKEMRRHEDKCKRKWWCLKISINLYAVRTKKGTEIFTLNHKIIRKKWYSSKSIFISKFIWVFSLSALTFSTSPLNLCIYLTYTLFQAGARYITFYLFIYFDVRAPSSSSSEVEGPNYQKISFIENLSESHCLGGQIKKKNV